MVEPFSPPEEILTEAQLIGLAEREVRTLTEENNHSAATLMQALINLVRKKK